MWTSPCWISWLFPALNLNCLSNVCKLWVNLQKLWNCINLFWFKAINVHVYTFVLKVWVILCFFHRILILGWLVMLLPELVIRNHHWLNQDFSLLFRFAVFGINILTKLGILFTFLLRIVVIITFWCLCGLFCFLFFF